MSGIRAAELTISLTHKRVFLQTFTQAVKSTKQIELSTSFLRFLLATPSRDEMPTRRLPLDCALSAISKKHTCYVVDSENPFVQ